MSSQPTPEMHNILKSMFSMDMSSEFTTDLEYMKSMDQAWHNWCQPQYKEQKRKWEESLKKE